MKLLWLNANLLLPLDKGGKLRTWHLMRQLAKRHDITYLSFEDPDERPEHRGGMREVCRELVTVPRTDPPKGTVGPGTPASPRRSPGACGSSTRSRPACSGRRSGASSPRS